MPTLINLPKHYCFKLNNIPRDFDGKLYAITNSYTQDLLEYAKQLSPILVTEVPSIIKTPPIYVDFKDAKTLIDCKFRFENGDKVFNIEQLDKIEVWHHYHLVIEQSLLFVAKTKLGNVSLKGYSEDNDYITLPKTNFKAFPLIFINTAFWGPYWWVMCAVYDSHGKLRGTATPCFYRNQVLFTV